MKEIKIPSGVAVSIDENVITLKGKLGSNTREFNSALVAVKQGTGSIIVEASSPNKRMSKKADNAEMALAKEIANDIKGVSEYFEIHMEAVYAHFPLTMEAKGQEFIIKNMFGERYPRIASMVGDTKAEIKDKTLRLYGTKLDDVTQTAANIRKACKAKHKDERIFQDGVYYALE